MRILLAEDDAVAGRTLTAILTAQGHEVTAVDNGVDAWALWQVSRHRVIVSDWLMPAMDGIELCRKIRSRPPGPYTYFMMQTIRTGLGNFLEAMKAGVDDFITKPIIPEELVARLEVAERILGLREELMTLEGLLAMWAAGFEPATSWSQRASRRCPDLQVAPCSSETYCILQPPQQQDT